MPRSKSAPLQTIIRYRIRFWARVAAEAQNPRSATAACQGILGEILIRLNRVVARITGKAEMIEA